MKGDRDYILALTVVLLGLLLILLVMGVPPARAQTAVITVNDFGKGMTPVATPFINDPSRIVYSENMYSTQPGTRQLRFGIANYMDVQGTDYAAHPDTFVSKLALFQPSYDTAQLVYTAGGVWYYVKGGAFQYGYGRFGQQVKVTDDSSFVVRPWTSGDPANDSLVVDSTGAAANYENSSFWLRHLQAGDSIFFDTGVSSIRALITHVISDDSIDIRGFTDDSTFRLSMSEVEVRRYYTAGSELSRPFMTQAGDVLYTGTNRDRPQAIWADSGDLYIRPLGLVDSMQIDSVYYGITDSLYTSIDTTYLNATTNDTIYIWRRMELVSRSKAWYPGKWAEDIEGNKQGYYLRLGARLDSDNQAATYQIIDNSDTSLVLPVIFMDTSGCAACTLYNIPDTSARLTSADLVGTWAYIYATPGVVETVHRSDYEDSLLLLSGAAVLRTTATVLSDTTQIDSINLDMHWLQLREPVDLAATPENLTEKRSVSFNRYTDSWPPDPVLTGKQYIADRGYECGEWVEDCNYFSGECEQYWNANLCTQWWVIGDSSGVYRQEPFLESFIHISRAYYEGDTLVMLTDGPYRVGDTMQFQYDSIWITNWSIVRTGFPRFGGMTEFSNRLMAWGDSLSPGRINLSDQFNHRNWRVIDDQGTVTEVFLNNGTEDPVVTIVPYDDRAVVLRANSAISYPDFSELSQTDGCVGQWAAIGLNKYLYWLAVDGVYRMERRDFQGYSVTKISYDIDPILNAWNKVTFGNMISPITINPQYAHKSVLTYNQRDQHLWLFFPANSSTTNSHVLTYDLQREQWDGVMTIAASDAIWANVADTSRILIGSLDSNHVFQLDYSYNDLGVGIDADLRSGLFWIPDQSGRPVQSSLDFIEFISRSLNGFVDSVHVIVDAVGVGGGSGTETFNVTADYPVSFTEPGTVSKKWTHNSVQGTYFQWRIRTYGSDSMTIFQPYVLNMHFKPLRRND